MTFQSEDVWYFVSARHFLRQKRAVYIVLLIKHIFSLASKTLLLWHLPYSFRNNVSLMSDIQNFKIVSAFNMYF